MYKSWQLFIDVIIYATHSNIKSCFCVYFLRHKLISLCTTYTILGHLSGFLGKRGYKPVSHPPATPLSGGMMGACV